MLRLLALVLAMTAAPAALAAARCNPTPAVTEALLHFADSQSAFVEQVTSAVRNGTDAMLLSSLGKPVTVQVSPLPSFKEIRVVLGYYALDDVAAIVERMRGDPALSARAKSFVVNNFACFSPPPYVAPVTVTEYYNRALDHYFMSGSIEENAFIDSGGAGPDWERTGEMFRTFSGGAAGTCDARGLPAVYRFYGAPGLGPNSHFYAVSQEECGLVREDRGWVYEGVGFGAKPLVNGNCPADNPRPLYRVYNNRWQANDSNHRYMLSQITYLGMIARGWIGEGIAMCLPATDPVQ